ncbi:class IV adenylate cyclase [Desulfoplanes sp.]
MSIESESKFLINDLPGLTGRLNGLGCHVAPWYFERNRVLDTAQATLRNAGILLRVRQANTAKLTLKRPLADLVHTEGIKQLEELECRISDAAVIVQILDGLGFCQTLAYEKFRSKWLVKGCKVCLDILCFGTFAEIEGPPEDIRRVASLLGLDPCLAVGASYHQLYQDHLKQRGCAPRHSFCFSPQERTLHMRRLGIEAQ